MAIAVEIARCDNAPPKGPHAGDPPSTHTHHPVARSIRLEPGLRTLLQRRASPPHQAGYFDV